MTSSLAPEPPPYAESLNGELRPADSRSPLVLDLFAGCGGLALGFEAAGFETHGFEMVSDYCATYRRNLRGECDEVFLTTQTPLPIAPVIIGGPPCQPFSVGGHQHGLKDSRDGFPAFIAAVERVRPEIWLFENVRGLFYKNRSYMSELLARLRALGYVVDVRLVNAANYGVPQNRERVIAVGHRGGFLFPPALPEVVTAGAAIADTADEVPAGSRFLTPSMDDYVARYEAASKCIRPRDLDFDRPARTLTTRNLAGATGDMQRIRLSDGRRRRLVVREAARLQSFPDWFQFSGSEGAQFCQIGNAVPPRLAFRLAESVRQYLERQQGIPHSPEAERTAGEQLQLVEEAS